MSQPGTPTNPLRVAIIGSGPAGFYTVSHLLKQRGLTVAVDMYERLPTPFGLVRAGVAPDHQKDKTVTRAYEKSALASSFCYFGNVEYGTHVQLKDLRRHYHQLVFATGAQSDRNLGIPGEDATGSHSATDFVAWYNGHPDFAGLTFDLSGNSAAVVGLGNVAIDVARILCKTPDQLAHTDMADYALAALHQSRISTVYILGRRGPVQAAFTPTEIREIGELTDTDIQIRGPEAALDELSQSALETSGDPNAAKNVAIIREFACREAKGRHKQLNIRFMVSPTEIHASEDGRVEAIEIVRNEAFQDAEGSVRARPTDEKERLPVDLVFRSVGYQGVRLEGIPFDDGAGTFRNFEGRIVNDSGAHLTGLYVVGWIKRGPTGVIGTNKTDARETVACMMADLSAGQSLQPGHPDPEAAASLVRSRQPKVVTYPDWRSLDAIEVGKGKASGRPRVKFTDVAEMLSVLGLGGVGRSE